MVCLYTTKSTVFKELITKELITKEYLDMPNYLVVNFYKFTNLPYYKDLQATLLLKCNELGIKGTILLASEGINASITGIKSAIDTFISYIRSISCFSDMQLNQNECKFMPFNKMKVRLKEEIVRLKVNGINGSNSGIKLKTDEWDQMILQEDTIVIDTRNYYEITFGTFKNAINPATQNFSEIVNWINNNIKDQKDKSQNIAMFCTGGIRCEKSTAYLKAIGFKNVYHLYGGVLQYLQDKQNSLLKQITDITDINNIIDITAANVKLNVCNNNDNNDTIHNLMPQQTPQLINLWVGDLFVFDDRLALNKNLQSLKL